ncbi:hypothetical protein Val02_28650 [Virgisporangium aliadipatigenens]|uniref:Uncharacterized protein n=1 Tax=Virgisporangium aliadipatigenens TaxID=741659 RepID=A0A8J3YIM5_9ACTN|nr:hypothetical protein [Virgisporangium aliadipatigenens]GIJ45979.1 hypothetical protein Val02_28650 [Virgisporangium aliadipatigenens]
MRRIITGCLTVLTTLAVVALTAAPAGAEPSGSQASAPAGAERATVEQMPRPETAPQVTVRTSAYFADCPQSAGYCTYDSGWEYYDGSCQARTQLAWWRGSNTVSIQVHVYSPFLFAACRVYSTPQFATTFNFTVSGGSFYAMACSATDPTCSNYQIWSYFDNSGLHPFFVPYVYAISAAHTKA